MNKVMLFKSMSICVVLAFALVSHAFADGGYFSKRSAALSGDQRAIIIKNGDEVSITFSTGYTGDGEDLVWIIPTPIPPEIEDVSETGENGEAAFEILDRHTSAKFSEPSNCFPAGTTVLTGEGPCAIETIRAGTEVYSCDPQTGEWALKRVLGRYTHEHDGDIVAIEAGQITIRATANHPFYVLSGDQLPLRPNPVDVPENEGEMNGSGRWVEACDLEAGDLLKAKNGEDLHVTNLMRRNERIEVYNLEVESFHNYAVHGKGILVHNKGSGETYEPTIDSMVAVYGRSALENYEISIVGGNDTGSILDWLKQNGYQVNTAARGVLDIYIEKNWAFVAAKHIPGERRRYEDAFMPALTVRYKHDRLVYPLLISSASTIRSAKITLYVIAESTVTSSNFSTETLRFNSMFYEPVNPEGYLESCIIDTAGDYDGRALVVMWSGEFSPSDDQLKIITKLGTLPFPRSFLTRLDSRIDPASMDDDIIFVLDSWYKAFQVRVYGLDFYSELMAAALGGETEAVEKLLLEGADVNARSVDGWTPLILAARGGHEETVRLLLETGADVNSVDEYGMTALMWAKERGHVETAGMLLKASADVKEGEYDATGLEMAARLGHKDVVLMLLERGADIDGRNETGDTAIISSARGGHIEIVRILLVAGASVNTKLIDEVRGFSGETALNAAAWAGHAGIVQLLLDAGARVNARGAYGHTALIIAVRIGNQKVARMLLDAGAYIGADQALYEAVERDDTPIVQMLLETGANANVRGSFRRTALMDAAKEGNAEVMQLLLQAGAKVNFKSQRGETALIYAVGAGHTEIVRILLEAGAKLNSVSRSCAMPGGGTNSTSEKRTALMWACLFGHSEVVKILLEAGADVNAKSSEGKTALNFAERWENKVIVDLLKEAGAEE